ncbi:MAG: glycosyltransferase family 4 protein [Candidatus Micrarchaeota archaeon]
MKKALFLVTELQRPVGGLHRFSTELFKAWRKKVKQNKTDFEPIIFSIKDPLLPLDDLKPSKDFSFLKGMGVFEAVRGGEKVYFLESKLSQKEQTDFYAYLWDAHGVPSHKSSSWDYYVMLTSFWKNMLVVAEELNKKNELAVVDCQDWLAFPAGFLIKEKLGIPLVCRIHSGEFGRSMGFPDFDSAPVNIEAAALMNADFVQSVSITEAKFELYRLLPLTKKITKRVARVKPPGFLEEQQKRIEAFEEFLLLESEDLNLFGKNAAGITNGIILDDWRKVTRSDILAGTKLFKKLLPGKKKYVLFVGRTETRKGLSTLIDAFALVKDSSAGLILASKFSEESKASFSKKISDLGLEGRVLIHDGWIEEKTKKSLFCAADVIALPSLYEPFGIVTLEGLAADLACEKNGLIGPTVIVGDTGGMREIIRNGVDGFKSPMLEDVFQLNPEYLSRILNMALADGDLRKKISEGGAKRIESKYFDWDYIITKIFCLYELAEKNAGSRKKPVK